MKMKIIPGRTVIPASKIYQEIGRFIQILGTQDCKDRITLLDEQLNSDDRIIYNEHYLKTKNPLLNEIKEYFHSQRQGISLTNKRSEAIQRLFSTSISVNRIYRLLSEEGKRELVKNLSADEVRPFLFEIQTMTHFLVSKFNIEFNDLDSLSSENNNFEFKVEKDGFVGEVECKWKDINAGSKIKREQFYKLADRIFNNIKSEKGSFRIDINVENKLEINDDQINHLGDTVSKSLLSGEKSINTDDGIRIKFTILPNVLSAEDAEELSRKTQSAKGHQAFIGTEDFSLYLKAESDSDDNIIKSIHRSLKKAEKQLSKKYPALIAIYLQNIEPDQFELLRTRSNLAGLATKYFRPKYRNYIHTISFTSNQSILYDDKIAYFQSPAVLWSNQNCIFETPQDPFQFNIQRHD